MGGSYIIVSSFLSAIILLQYILESSAATSTCKRLSACSCKTDTGFKLDLSSLSNSDNTPRYQDVVSELSPSTVYSWNPCSGFNEGTCNQVSVCEVTGTGSLQSYSEMGTPDNAQFITTESGIDVKYTDGKKPVTIHISCDKSTSGNLQPVGDVGKGVIEMSFPTKYACKHSTLSAGTYICLIFLGIIVLYICVGLVVQTLIRKQKGRHSLPNYDFWSSFPGLVKDGTLFVVKRGKVDKHYDKI